jgi:hypothetical protein
MMVPSGAFSRLMNSCEPHFEQNIFSRFGDERYEVRCSEPSILSALVGTSALVEKAAPWAFLHMEQWQFSALLMSDATS